LGGKASKWLDYFEGWLARQAARGYRRVTRRWRQEASDTTTGPLLLMVVLLVLAVVLCLALLVLGRVVGA
jgi:hypothetical protein